MKKNNSFMFYTHLTGTEWELKMATEIKRSYDVMELHAQGEPWSLMALENIPHLHSLAQAVRRILHANKSLRDIQLQNKLDYQSFVNHCNSNLFFYLKITQQYYLLSTLFKNPKMNKKWIYFIDRVRYREFRKRQFQPGNLFKLKAGKLITDAQLNSLFAWSHPDPSLSAIEKLAHYEDEIQRITLAYHNAKTDVYHHATDENIKELDNIIDLMAQDGAAIAEINRVRESRSLLAQRQNEAVRKNKTGLGINALVQHGAARQKLYRDSKVAISSSYDYLSSEQKRLATIRAQKIDQDVIKNNHIIDRSFSREIQELNNQVKQTLKLVKADIHKLIASTHNKLKHIDPTQLTVDQRKELEAILEKIQQLNQSLAVAENLKFIQGCLAQFSNVIKYASPSISGRVYNALKNEMAALNRFIAQSKSKRIEGNHAYLTHNMPSAPVNPTKPSAPPLGADVRANHTKTSTSVSATAAHRFYNLSPEISVDRVINEPSAPAYEARGFATLLEPNAHPHGKEPDSVSLALGNATNSRYEAGSTKMATAISITKNMRASLFSHKEKIEDFEQQDFAVDKVAINKILSEVSSKLVSIRDMDLLNPDDDVIARYLINVINEVQSLQSCNYREKIQEISTKVTSLSASYSALSALNEQTNYLNAQIGQVAEQRVTLSM